MTRNATPRMQNDQTANDEKTFLFYSQISLIDGFGSDVFPRPIPVVTRIRFLSSSHFYCHQFLLCKHVNMKDERDAC